ncbi:MAG: outer membrane lipoprotein-sorting protein [Gammaproteobacteria bacterium]|nr:outer membrane lipoprotein-sorting protein [Gammaproteobacteria bacterium]
MREQEVNGRDTWVLQLTPQEEGTPIARHLVYVDQQQYTLNRITTYPRNDKPLTLSTTYGKFGKAYLPTEANIDGYTRRKRHGEETVEEVHIKLVWDKYKINVGLKDSEFEDGK